jgi:amino acid permease
VTKNITHAHMLAIGITYLRFFYGLKAQGINRRELPYRAPLQPYLTMSFRAGKDENAPSRT